MPKRKREQDCTEQSGVKRKSVTREPSCRPPLRKSARLQEQRDPTVRRGKQTQQLHKLPSPPPSHSLDQVFCRKRKQSDTDDNPTAKQPRPSETGPEARDSREDHRNPIEHWRETGYWPSKFADRKFKMGDSQSRSSSSNKRLRTSSYTQSVRDGDAPKQYTPAYQIEIGKNGLDMDILRGEELVSKDSKKLCLDLQDMKHLSIPYAVAPEGTTRKVINLCRTRNESTVQRVVTSIIIPPIIPLYFGGNQYLEHIIDEVNTDWYKSCFLTGPLPRPDLAIGFSFSGFTSTEIDKMKSYATIDNWTQFTDHMYFPFLVCEVKCGKEGIDRADRQNMHSSSVAVRALLRIEQEADKYRSERRLALLNSRILVFSVSHDHHGARLYGHYALIEEEKWTYHRYAIKEFHLLTGENDALVLYNFVQNLLKSYAQERLEHLKNALTALPDPTTLSFSTSEMALQDNSQQGSQDQDAVTFKKPGLPANALQSEELAKMSEQMEKQREQMEKQNSELLQQLQQQRKDAEQQRKDAEQRNDTLMAQLEHQRKEFMALLHPGKN